MWPLLTENAASPRDFLPTTEVSILWGTRWKLLTLAGQSQYYSVRQTHKRCHTVSSDSDGVVGGPGAGKQHAEDGDQPAVPRRAARDASIDLPRRCQRRRPRASRSVRRYRRRDQATQRPGLRRLQCDAPVPLHVPCPYTFLSRLSEPTSLSAVDVIADKEETTNLAQTQPAVVSRMLAEIATYKAYGALDHPPYSKFLFSMNASMLKKYKQVEKGADATSAADGALEYWHGFWG